MIEGPKSASRTTILRAAVVLVLSAAEPAVEGQEIGLFLNGASSVLWNPAHTYEDGEPRSHFRRLKRTP